MHTSHTPSSGRESPNDVYRKGESPLHNIHATGNDMYACKIICKGVTGNLGDGASTLALKPMGGVNWSPKQRVPVAPQNGDIVTAKLFLKKILIVSYTAKRKADVEIKFE